MNINIKFIAKKAVALGLIISSLIKISFSISDTLFIYPKLILAPNPDYLYLELIKKAIILSTALFINSAYGFSLLIKPIQNTKFIHIILGLALFIFSFTFYKLTAFDQLLNGLLFSPIS